MINKIFQYPDSYTHFHSLNYYSPGRWTGTATYTFDEPSGAYDTRISYFDEEKGQSKVRLLIAGKEKAAFKMDEDTDCWRWRMFCPIRISCCFKQGICLVLHMINLLPAWSLPSRINFVIQISSKEIRQIS